MGKRTTRLVLGPSSDCGVVRYSLSAAAKVAMFFLLFISSESKKIYLCSFALKPLVAYTQGKATGSVEQTAAWKASYDCLCHVVGLSVSSTSFLYSANGAY